MVVFSLVTFPKSQPASLWDQNFENISETKDIKFNSDDFKDTSINCEEATIIAQALYLILYYRQKLF